MKKSYCPKCGNKKDVIEIVYGFPTDEAMEKSKRGEIKLGGCCVNEDNPDWHCKSCQISFKTGRCFASTHYQQS